MRVDTDMDFPTAMSRVLEGRRVARRHWASDEYCRPHGYETGDQFWIGAIRTVDFGLPPGKRAYDDRIDSIHILYRVRLGAASFAAIDKEWRPSLPDSLAKDWYVVTP